jgi:predicted transcriptional regulator
MNGTMLTPEQSRIVDLIRDRSMTTAEITQAVGDHRKIVKDELLRLERMGIIYWVGSLNGDRPLYHWRVEREHR